MTLRVIITGASGMVGEGVMYECLQREDVTEILVVGRRSCGHTHSKLKEIIHSDLYDLSPIEDHQKGYDACFFCLGMSSIGVKEAEFTKVTYDLTMHFATTLSKHNPSMTFCYVSGRGTDIDGKLMWQRVKGKTENDLMHLLFKRVYNFRPGIIKPTKGLKHVLPLYKWTGWMIPIINAIAPKSVVTLKQVGDSMIKVSKSGFEKNIIEVKDIFELTDSISQKK